jgi:hypothetical protein
MTHALGQAPNKNLFLQQGSNADAPPAPRSWIVVVHTTGAHIYLKENNQIGRIADENACCTKPFPETDKADSRFLPALAAWLGQAEKEEAFDRLVLLGSGEALAFMHTHLPQKAHDRICSARAKETAEVRENEIEDHLISVAWV